MVKKDIVYITDICKAPFIDRLFYVMLNDLKVDLSDRSYMTLNPLKWSLMTAFTSVYIAIVYLVLVPIVMTPLAALDAYRMPAKYKSKDFIGYYREGVYLIRDID